MKTRIPELDGIRGLAIILVLLTHFGAETLQPVGRLQGWLYSGLHLGWSGVDLFFVLSGYLITSILLRSREDKDYYPPFYIRRSLRIVPLYAVFLIAFGLISLAGGWASTEQFWYWAYLSNVRNAIGAHIPPMNHFWSLAIEEQFYLAWPFFVRNLRTRALGALCVTIAATSLLLRLWFAWHPVGGPEFVFKLTPFRLEPLAYGALIAVAFFSGYARVVAPLMKYVALVGALLLAFAVRRTGSTWYIAPMMEALGYSGVALINSAAVFLGIQHSGSWRFGILRSGVLAWFAKHSYGIYVLHMPLVVWFVPVVRRSIGTTPVAALVAIVAGTGVACAAAWVSLRVIETPAQQLKGRFGRARLLQDAAAHHDAACHATASAVR